MPTPRQHLRAMQRQTDTRPGFKTLDSRQQKIVAAHAAFRLRASKKRRHQKRSTVQRRSGMKIIQLEALE